ncbi:hypothetical protein NC651_013705 [Populus alba x Populus x berolinensis]|nr:hypothetical protein NC651_013705 [Populus alba x Populus x berolinensis]
MATLSHLSVPLSQILLPLSLLEDP